ncbi:MAG: glycogen debranching protein GlgX [Burkholderiales bacterium]|nr:glycogen debranching protein GlgX [Burkholderiales bacterium]
MALSLGLVPGSAHRLGSHWDGAGVNFAVYALNADRVELCLFDAAGHAELARLPLPGQEAGVWHGYLPEAEPGLVYGYRAYGPFLPHAGLRYNPNKLLFDPYARMLHGRYRAQPDYCDHLPGDPCRPDPRNNAAQAVKAIVYSPGFGRWAADDWTDDVRPAIPWCDTVIYELHVKGFSQRNAAIPQALRGTYAGLAHPASIDWLRWLGITTVELLPVAACADEGHLLQRGLVNYWGYNPLAFMAVESRYASDDDPVGEFKMMVKALHRAGIEVLLDVVYNHTAEGGVGGPSFNLRGLDNTSYYRMQGDGHYENWTGCGNTLHAAHPRCMQLILDAMRFWAEECHVDGFRFDLAPTIARMADGAFSGWSACLAAIQADPVLSRLKLIAEPWDMGPEGYRLGGFPPGWAEWNDRFRDTLRSFWLHRGVTRGEFARRLTGSSEIFERRGRRPWASVNFIAAHDGFDLHDLTSYAHKHNEANGEGNRDGHDHNLSCNGGIEGPTEDASVLALRGRLRRALMATLTLSQGTPMLLAGDELGHTQRGNNNAYCQDNETSWLDWSAPDDAFAAFTKRMLALRTLYPALRYANWFSAEAHGGYERADVDWRNAAGRPMTPAEWDAPGQGALIVEFGPEDTSDRCLVLVNADAQPTSFMLRPGRWLRVLDTADPEAGEALFQLQVEVPAHALWILIMSHEGRVTW